MDYQLVGWLCEAIGYGLEKAFDKALNFWDKKQGKKITGFLSDPKKPYQLDYKSRPKQAGVASAPAYGAHESCDIF